MLKVLLTLADLSGQLEPHPAQTAALAFHPHITVFMSQMPELIDSKVGWLLSI